MIYILMALNAAFFVVLGVEYLFHAANRRAVALRVHVNGTRGKSSVTRLIGAALGLSMPTLAKTTGSAARLIFEDGTEEPIVRMGQPRIIEQLRVFRIARRRRARGVVVECMALDPLLQRICERLIVKAHIAVITNVRADHFDVMGPTVRDIAEALASVTPQNGTLVARSGHFDEVFARQCRKKNSQLVLVTDSEVAEIDENILSKFNYLEHAENVALALAACLAAGVERQEALEGMYRARPDVGALKVLRGQAPGGKWIFVDAFAANDPDSTVILWNILGERFAAAEKKILVLNCRSDRIDRSRQLGRIMAQHMDANIYVFTGQMIRPAVRAATVAGAKESRIIRMENAAAEQVFDFLAGAVDKTTLIFAVGNIKGTGQELSLIFTRAGDRNA